MRRFLTSSSPPRNCSNGFTLPRQRAGQFDSPRRSRVAGRIRERRRGTERRLAPSEAATGRSPDALTHGDGRTSRPHLLGELMRRGLRCDAGYGGMRIHAIPRARSSAPIATSTHAVGAGDPLSARTR
jgi:hypothetical protein